MGGTGTVIFTADEAAGDWCSTEGCVHPAERIARATMKVKKIYPDLIMFGPD
jgi:hypothetical protein